jgi:anti-anti-sigma factor
MEHPMQFEVSESQTGKACKLRLHGRLDTAGVDAVEARFLATVVSGGRDALIDLSDVPMITSMGIRMLISAARGMSQRKTRLVLFAAQDLVREALETAAVDTLIALVPSEAEALQIAGT